jgi:transcription initiation factor IIF auxiliary subunit
MKFTIKATKIAGVAPRQIISKYKHYRVRIFLEADDDEAQRRFQEIVSVTYELHPTFPDRFQTSVDLSKKFEIQIWTWGWFRVKAKVQLKDSAVVPVENDIEW